MLENENQCKRCKSKIEEFGEESYVSKFGPLCENCKLLVKIYVESNWS